MHACVPQDTYEGWVRANVLRPAVGPNVGFAMSRVSHAVDGWMDGYGRPRARCMQSD
jgi:hypothetical protein